MPHPQIERLIQINQEELEQLYQRVFESEEGKLVLEDLKARFWFYRPIEGPNSESIVLKAGQQSVIMHIQNMANPLPIELQDKLRQNSEV